MKRTVVITEELERIIEVEVPDNLTEEEANRQALEQVQDRYDSEEIVLGAEDYHRTFWYVGADEEEALENSVEESGR